MIVQRLTKLTIPTSAFDTQQDLDAVVLGASRGGLRVTGHSKRSWLFTREFVVLERTPDTTDLGDRLMLELAKALGLV